MQQTEAMREIAGGTIRPFYLLYGGEPFLTDELVTELRQRMVDGAAAGFNLHVFQWGSGRLAQALDVAHTLPWLAERRLVVLRNCPLFGRKGRGDDTPERDEGEEAALQAYLDRPVPSTCLVIIAEAVDSRRRLTKTAMAAGGVVECKELREDAAVGWVQRRAAHLEKKIDAATAGRLVAKLGPDLYRLDMELTKLALYAGERKGLSATDIDLLVPGTAPAEIFDLLDAVGRRRPADALSLLRRFLDRGDPGPLLLAQIARHVRMLILARWYAHQGTPPDRVAAQRGQHPFYWKKLTEQARNFSREELVAAMAGLLQADLGLKSGQDPAHLLEGLVVAMVTRGQVAGAAPRRHRWVLG